MTMEVIETEDGFDISWDPNDPVERVMNHWTAASPQAPPKARGDY